MIKYIPVTRDASVFLGPKRSWNYNSVSKTWVVMSGRLGFKSWLWHLPQLYDYVLYLCLVTQSCPALYNPMDYSQPGASVHGILQARILEWVAMPSSRGSSQARDQTQVSHIAVGFLTGWATREVQEYWSGKPISSPGEVPDPGIKRGSPVLQADS